MSQSLHESIYEAISSIRLIDPHTHINPHSPASSTLADILGYHYYTELVHSSGMPREEIEEEGLPPKELVRRLVQGLPNIENTANYQWLISICRMFFDFEDTRIDQSNWEALYDASEERMNNAEWPQLVLDQSNVEAVFLTNDFDDDLEGFDTNTYIPCLRTDDLVFHLAKPETRQRLEVCSGIELDGSLESLRSSLEQRFQHFVTSGARACAISIPPDFEPLPISDGRARTALDHVLSRGTAADSSHRVALSRRVFWTLAELCDQYGLPFDLMIGVNRGVYPGGVYQGQDLFDSRVSLIQYRELFNTFRDVKFPVSVLASVTNQELVSYSWIFPNLITNGHWWYSNTPSFIARDAAARLEAVPKNNQIGYYSDAYKLEFVWPKFDMYRRILAGILADHFVGFCGWSEERAIELGRQVLRDNVDEVFPAPEDPGATTAISDTYIDDTVQMDSESVSTGETTAIPDVASSASAALAAGAIGMVEVQDSDDQAASDEELYAADDQQDVQQVDTEYEEFDEDDEDAELDYLEEEVESDQDESPAELQQTVEELQQTVEEFDAVGEGDVDFTVDEEYDTVDEEVLPDRPTVVELQDTVRIEEDQGESSFDVQTAEVDPVAETVEMDAVDVTEMSDAEMDPMEVDALPTDDEIEAVEDVPDVELQQPYADTAPDAADIQQQAEDQPLDVGNVLEEEHDQDASVFDEADQQQAEDDGEIRMLRGETSFTPDEESMQLTRDPVTGELIFPVEQEEESDDLAEVELEPVAPAEQISDDSALEYLQEAEGEVEAVEYEEEMVEAAPESEATIDLQQGIEEVDDGAVELEFEAEEVEGVDESDAGEDQTPGLATTVNFGEQPDLAVQDEFAPAPEQAGEVEESETELETELEATVELEQHPGLQTTLDLSNQDDLQPDIDLGFGDEPEIAGEVDETVDFGSAADLTVEIEEAVDANEEVDKHD